MATDAELTVVAEATAEGEPPEGAPPVTGELLEVLSSGTLLAGALLDGATDVKAIGVVAPLL